MAAAAAKTARTEPSADSYIGSLISLTSKSEIRYEGVLFNINTEESSIGLRNVRSFGTEGRKKDGPQIPPGDKVYEYILFRGSDIKDLQVKSSPPAQPAAPIHNDPAIIQSHYSRPAAPSTLSTTLPSAGGTPVTETGSHPAQPGAPRAAYQTGLPLYQPGGSLPSWGTSPSTAINAQGLAMPMYWQGFYAPAGGMPPAAVAAGGLPPPPGGMPHLQPPSLLRPPGLGVPHSLPQQPLQYPGISQAPPLSSQGPHGLPNLPSQDAPPLPGISSFPGTNPSVAPPSLPSLPSILPPGSLSLPEIPPLLSSAALPASTVINTATKPPITSLPALTVTLDSPLASSSDNKSKSSTAPLIGKEAANQLATSVTSVSEPLPYQSMPDASKPPLITPGQLAQPGLSNVAPSQVVDVSSKSADARAISSETQEQGPVEAREPILPLPRPSVQNAYETSKNGAAPLHTAHHVNRGRGRGRGRGQTFSRTAMRFTEDFDFTAMNEKFNKDEVWGHLGKGRDREENAVEDYAEDIDYERDSENAKAEATPVYVKDDFFDSLSSNSTGGGSRNGRVKFSEQMKIDTETFGDFPRHRPGRGGGRGFRGGGGSGGGRTRGSSFYGRGYAYGGRGQGRN